jgi:hypothetical protein
MNWSLGHLLALALANCSVIPSPRAGNFPSKNDALPSPDGESILFNVDSQNDADFARLGDSHAIFLQNTRTLDRKNIHSYQRHVTASWSPNSRFVTINDFEASNRSTCYIYTVANGTLIDVTEPIRQALNSEHANHHLYFQAMEWRNDSTIKVRVAGVILRVRTSHEVAGQNQPPRGA